MARTGISTSLEALFNPSSVAVIGASENQGKLGFHVIKSLIRGKFEGTIIPVNPRSRMIMGIRAFPSMGQFKESVDLAVVVLPAPSVPEVFEACIEKGVKGIVLITAGFREIDDPQGALLQDRLADLVNQAGIPVIGPNTFGIVNLHRNLNASFTPELSLLRGGDVALVSQSGGISHLLAFMAMKQGMPISKVIGLGNRLNIDFPETVAYLMEDPDTRVIILYLEGLDEPRGLLNLSAQSRVTKPILAYKGGTTPKADHISLSHTGSLAGRKEIYGGALRQAGILLEESLEGLLDLAQALRVCPLPEGRRVGILSAQAGPGMVACDVCEGEGLEITSFTAPTQKVINALLPPIVLRSNPVDMGPVFSEPLAITKILRQVLEDEQVDALLLIMLFASANRDVVAGIRELLLQWGQRKPLVASLLAPPGIWDEEVDALQSAGALVNYASPERAARVMGGLWRYKKMVSLHQPFS